MNMQGKQLFPMRKGEDPSLPWPDCGMHDVPAQPGPVMPMPQTGNNAVMPEGSGYDRDRDRNRDRDRDRGRDRDYNRGRGHENDENHNAMPPEGGMQLPSDSIDPRLLSLAMAFVPRQSWETPYDFDVALKRGTIFPALDKPFLGEEALHQ